MKFADLNWMMLEDYLKKDDRVMVVLGMTEEHSHLSLLTDSLIAEKLAEAASEQTGVLIAPTLHFGVSPSLTSYPGTLSLKLRTYLHLIEDLTRSLHAHGFRRILFLNGHGGNAPARTQIAELVNELEGLQASWYQWFTSPKFVAFSKAHGLPNCHANWEENFRFTRVAAASPIGEKPPLPQTVRVYNARQTKQIVKDGSFGGPWQVSDAVMDEAFRLCVQEVVNHLQFNFDL